MKVIKEHNIEPNHKKKKENIIRHTYKMDKTSPKVTKNVDLVNQKKQGNIVTTVTLILLIVTSAINPISLAVSLIAASIIITPYLYKTLTRR